MTSAPVALYEAGGLGADSLFVRLDFTQEAFLAAVASSGDAIRSGKPQQMPEALRTYVHELSHYVQYSTTPYGLFLHHCRRLQNRATIAIAQALLASVGGFSLPLLENIPPVNLAVDSMVNRNLSIWLNIENLVASLAADSPRRASLTQAFVEDMARIKAGIPPRRPPLLPLQDTFARIQLAMAEHYAQWNQNAAMAGNKVPMYCPVAAADQAAIQQEIAAAQQPLSDQDAAALRVNDALDLLGGTPWSMEAVIESAATAAEFWGSDISYEDFVAWVEAPVDSRLRVYRNCISQGLASIQSRDLYRFIPSYIALCELALESPLLPQHAALRQSKADFRQILPTHRWAELIRAAAKVEPMDGRSDHGRYVTDLCSVLNWVHPLQIAKAAVDGPTQLSEPLSQIYGYAQRRRATKSGDFIGIHRFLIEDTPDAAAWREAFNFVIVDYADRTVCHPNEGFLRSMTTRNLEALGLRCIMEGNGLLIAAPYRADAAQLQEMTDWLQARFKTLFDRDFPMLRIVS